MVTNRRLETIDGNTAAAYVSYAFTELAFVYPITPSSVMADIVDKYANLSKKENLFGNVVKVTQMQSEAGVAGALHGALSAGSLATTYTASQGLLLMIPNMYKIAGELLPCVIHVAARTIAGHALSIFGDHSDVYACRQTGFAMLCSNSPQEVMDLSAVAHLSAIKGRIPFLHFFDGFRTSHEIQKVQMWDYKDLEDLLDFSSVTSFKKRALNPERPVLRGSAQNDDIFFQVKEASNSLYLALPKVVEDYMNKVNNKLGTNYSLFNYYGHKEPDRIIVSMGSVCETIEEVVDYLNDHNEQVGLVKVRLYRPFSLEHFLKIIPKSVKCVSVLDRTKEPGSLGEPLYLDVAAAFLSSGREWVKILRGRYGLSSKDTSPKDILAIFDNMKDSFRPKQQFTVGINDDVTNLSLTTKNIDFIPSENTYSCKFWGFGSDGTVSANKNSIKIIGNNTDLFVQGYFAYDSKKSGGLTVSHLRFGKQKIRSAYYVKDADFVACHNFSYIYKYPAMVNEIKFEGKFLINCPYKTEEELNTHLPDQVKYHVFNKRIDLYVIDAVELAKDIGLGGRVNTILQSAFFKITNIIDSEDAIKYMKEAALKTYGKKGEKVVKMNYEAIEYGAKFVKRIGVPSSFASAKMPTESEKRLPECDYNSCGFVCNGSKFAESSGKLFPFLESDDICGSDGMSQSCGFNSCKFKCKEPELVKGTNAHFSPSELKNAHENGEICPDHDCAPCSFTHKFANDIQKTLNKYEGNNLPVSKFLPYLDGTLPLGTSSFEKRNTAAMVPQWNKDYCIQCNMCSMVCPHSVIRPFILNKSEKESAPVEVPCKEAIGLKGEGLFFSIGISSKDCTSCGLCANICPGIKSNKALNMVQNDNKVSIQQDIFDFLVKLPEKKVISEKFNMFTVKGSQFRKPLLEFSGACAGCGETPYAKLVTQLFGPNIYIANATGCSSIWGGSAGSVPYTITEDGRGPAWQNSLFEDNAEFGLGLELSRKYGRDCLNRILEKLVTESKDEKLSTLYSSYLETYDDIKKNQLTTSDIFDYISSKEFTKNIEIGPEVEKILKKVLEQRIFLSKKSTWIFGGDGWAYDIGFGGLDHIFASGENLNILVFDTEVYSNTGGQASKATPKGAIAQFASSGKKMKKKNLAAMAMAYEDVYVASVALGANMNQCIKAMKEAFEYPGVSLIIAYSPCIEHGIKGGMVNADVEQKRAVECGHWKLFRYNPILRDNGKDPLILDSKLPVRPYEEFLAGESRFKINK